jgi:hypothetical protein
MPSKPHSPTTRPPWMHAVLLLAVTVLAYRNALTAGFQFDDFNVIVLNASAHGLQAWWDSMPGIRPLLKLGYSLNWAISASAVGFHGVNLAIHLANVLLAYLMFRQWCELVLPPSDIGAGHVALVGALLFALHPANTEAVTYVSGRSVSQMTLFYLTATTAFLALRKRAAPLHIWAVVLPLFMMALATKEIAWTLPLAMALVLWLAGQRALHATWPAWLLGAAGLALLLAIPGYLGLLARSLETRGVLDNLLTQAEGIHYLVTYSLLGLRPNIDPDIPVRLALSEELAWKMLILGLPIGLAWNQRHRRPWLSLGIFWFFLHLLPTNSVLARLDVANDRQLYLAMLGPAFILAVALARLQPRMRYPLLLVLTLLLASRTYVRNADYRDEISLWQATTRDSPLKARPWNNLGYAYQLRGDKHAAQAAYEQALRLDPKYLRARTNLEQLRPSGD